MHRNAITGSPILRKKSVRGHSLPKIAPQRVFRGTKFRIFTPLQKRLNDRDAVWVEDLGGPREPCIIWGPDPPTERDNCEGGGQSGHKVGEKIISFPGFSIAIITARGNAHIASAVLAIAIPSVCLCLSLCLTVRLSHAGIVSKRRHVARCSLHCRIAKCV